MGGIIVLANEFGRCNSMKCEEPHNLTDKQQPDSVCYIVAGDAMQRLMTEKYPDRKTIPFREDLSAGNYQGFSIDSEFISQRASFWDITEDEYTQKLYPIINIDLTDKFVLCFGDDECCRANLKFMIGYLRSKGYTEHLKIQIVDEYNLDLLNEYFIE